MKKFRTATSAAIALSAALALAACSPPHQKEADTRVDTVTTGPTAPSIYSTETSSADATGTETAGTDAMGMEIDPTDSSISEGNSQYNPSTGSVGVADTTGQTGAAVTDTSTGH